MMTLFRHLRIAYYVLAIGGGLALWALLWLSGVPFVAALAVGALLWNLVCAVVFEVLANRRYRRIVQLREEGQVHAYVAEHEYLLAQKCSPAAREILLLNAFAGYHTLGNFGRAADYLFAVQAPDPAQAKGAKLGNACVYYADLCAFYTAVKDFERGEEALAVYRSLLDRPFLNEAMRTTAVKDWTDRHMALRVARGEYEGTDTHFELALNTEQKRLARVAFGYNLVRIYAHTARPQQAVDMYRFVVENGGDSGYAALAYQELAEAGIAV